MQYRFLAIALGSALSLVMSLGRAEACCSISSERNEAKIASQKVLVVWDPVTKMEHFVREAKFSGSGEDFGFLVPTPEVPEIVEAPSGIFSLLEAAVAPRVEERQRLKFELTSLFASGRSLYTPAAGYLSKSAESRGVELLSRSIVAGFEVLILQSTSAAVLTDWLRENKFVLRDSVTDWLKPYIELKWKVSAFRFVGEAAEGATKVETEKERIERMMRRELSEERGVSEAVTKTIRMSFKTSKPLFPYRVPRDELSASRSSSAPATPLHLYFIGAERVVGQFGEAASPWKQELLFAGPLADPVRDRLPAFCRVTKAFLTAFEDKSWPGGTEDLYFSGDSDPSTFQRVEIRWINEVVPVPVEILIFCIAGLGGLVWFLRSRAAKASKSRGAEEPEERSKGKAKGGELSQ